MRIKLDENLSLRLKAGLAELGHDADTVRDEELTGRPDGDVWAPLSSISAFSLLSTEISATPDCTRRVPTQASSLRACRTQNSIAPRSMFWAGSSGTTQPTGLGAWW